MRRSGTWRGGNEGAAGGGEDRLWTQGKRNSRSGKQTTPDGHSHGIAIGQSV